MSYSFFPSKPLGRISKTITIKRMVEAGTIGGVGLKTTSVKGIGMPIGCLYFAKWFHPDLFEDIDPEEVHEELVQEFFGQELEGAYVYP